MRGAEVATPARQGPHAVPPRAGQIGRIIFRQVVYTLPRTGRPHPGKAGRAPARPRSGPWTHVNISPRRGVWGNQVPPRPRPREGAGAALTQGDGATGFPHPPARWRVWEGAALPGRMFIPSVCGGAAWTADGSWGRPILWRRGEHQFLPSSRRWGAAKPHK
jgi:hypothetical protein